MKSIGVEELLRADGGGIESKTPRLEPPCAQRAIAAVGALFRCEGVAVAERTAEIRSVLGRARRSGKTHHVDGDALTAAPVLGKTPILEPHCAQQAIAAVGAFCCEDVAVADKPLKFVPF